MLEQAYDGPLPEPLLRGSQYAAIEQRLLLEARAQTELFAALIRGQIEAIRRARGDGPIPSMLIDDLALYRRQEFWWRREKERIEAILAMPLADDVP
ncbi:MAG: hypothetical protein ACREFC_14025 [Stellaceae bacterium]